MRHNVYLYILGMWLVSYLIRVLPLTLIRREITNRTIRSFLYYVPYVTRRPGPDPRSGPRLVRRQPVPGLRGLLRDRVRGGADYLLNLPGGSPVLNHIHP